MTAHGSPSVDLEVIVRLADEFGISAAAARIRLETVRFLKKGQQTNELKARIESGEHKYLEMRLGLGELTDELWRAQHRISRKPAPLFLKALQAYEEGYLDLDRVAELLEMAPADLSDVVAERGTVVLDEDDDPDFSTGESR